ncbi:ORF1 [Pitorquevirus ursid8]|uniref:Capsid protein n=1 Tax=Giant panda anellovirus TaxID=2016460 RepID=A0A220IGH1_9VIRU|nr:ORF1 [Giant panda anellovirus]ASH99085.1 ORF1 [Giant panda anellovirus]
MPYRRRYRRGYRRHFFRHRKWRRPRRHWRRAWRRYRRPRVRTVKQTQPRRITPLLVSGWEIMGIQGSQIDFVYNHDQTKWELHIKHIAPTNKEVKYLSLMVPENIQNTCSDVWRTTDIPKYWDFVGGYGEAKFDLQSLVLRNLLGMNRFSENIRGYSYIKYLGFSFQLIRAPTLDYLFRPQVHRAPYEWERPLIHPAVMLNMPFVKWVQSVERSNCCRSPTIKRRAGPDLSGWFDMEVFRNYELVSYQWSVFDPNNPMGRNTEPIKSEAKPFFDDSWMRPSKPNQKVGGATLNDRIRWQDRSQWDYTFVNNIENLTKKGTVWEWLWGNKQVDNTAKTTPFLPPIIESPVINTFWFRYRFKFLLGGSTMSRNLQQWPIRETNDDLKPCTGENTCPWCIGEGDLDAVGQLTEEAFQRITESPEHRKKRLVEKLARIIRQRRKRKRVSWWDEKKRNASPAHPNPKKKRAQCIRYLATRLRF